MCKSELLSWRLHLKIPSGSEDAVRVSAGVFWRMQWHLANAATLGLGPGEITLGSSAAWRSEATISPHAFQPAPSGCDPTKPCSIAGRCDIGRGMSHITTLSRGSSRGLGAHIPAIVRQRCTSKGFRRHIHPFHPVHMLFDGADPAALPQQDGICSASCVTCGPGSRRR